ncbi:MAG: RHS repeat-associated core domain-containing protein [Azonexus sp.]|jgi:uncharacterized protein RhaS with RHS repeats|nr:RHS repeat-associated core domain-containing protein [Azonexus sp.]
MSGRLLYNYFRDYDPLVGRFTQPDPIGFAGGSWSLYSYVNGNPLSFVDPEGLRGGCPTGMKPGDGGVCKNDPSEPSDTKVCV